MVRSVGRAEVRSARSAERRSAQDDIDPTRRRLLVRLPDRDRSAADTEQLASSLEGNDGVYFVPALTGLGSPYWDAEARGTIVGLTRGATKAHLARASLEAIAYQAVDAVRAIEESCGVELTELRADGGATANSWLMQFQADVLGVPVGWRRAVESARSR